MSKLKWDEVTKKLYETGVKQCVLYPMYDNGSYGVGVAWSGITAITESPSGADETALYADDTKYLSLRAREEFGGTIEAYMYPDEWAACDGSVSVIPGVVVGQQKRKPFGLCYRTVIGNDTEGDGYGYKLHIIFNATASPSSRDYATINDSPEAITFSWEFTTTPVPINGYDDISIITIESTKVDSDQLEILESILYGTSTSVAALPSPDQILHYLQSTAVTWSRTALTPLGTSRRALRGASVGNYALFAGGRKETSSSYTVVDAYNNNLVRSTPDGLSNNRYNVSATHFNNYALFGGGVGPSDSFLDTVNAYDRSLTRSSLTPLSHARGNAGATTVGNYALFGGGNPASSVVEAYSKAFTRTTATPLSNARYALSAAVAGNYALFGGGTNTGTEYAVVDAYNTELTRTTATPLSRARHELASTSNNNSAIFAGGEIGSTTTSAVDVFNANLTHELAVVLGMRRKSMAATTVGNYALFGGGFVQSSTYLNAIDIYDTNLTRMTNIVLSEKKYDAGAATVGNYALFGGGAIGSGFSNTVDAFSYQ